MHLTVTLVSWIPEFQAKKTNGIMCPFRSKVNLQCKCFQILVKNYIEKKWCGVFYFVKWLHVIK